MQQQILGIVAPVPKGEWTPLANYQKLNIVRRNGTSYMATAANTDIQPGVDPGWESYWMLLNEDGQGEEGDQGPAGPGVPTGGLQGEVLVKSSNTNYDTDWVPQSQIAAGSAENDGDGNNIVATYETKSDATAKNTTLQNQITQNAQNIEQNAQIGSRNAKRLDGLEQRINPSPFVTDSTVAYQKDVPGNAVGAVELQAIGGMTYRDTATNTLKNSPVTAVKSVGANLIPFPYTENTKTVSGLTFTVNADGSINIAGTATANISFYLIGETSAQRKPIEAGTYTASITGSPNVAFIIGIAGDAEYNSYAGSNKVITVGSKTTYYARLRVLSGVTVNSTVYPMFNIGSTALPYAPYTESTLTIPTNVQALDGYGQGINATCYNHISWSEGGTKKTFTKMVEEFQFTGNEEAALRGTNAAGNSIYALTIDEFSNNGFLSADFAFSGYVPGVSSVLSGNQQDGSIFLLYNENNASRKTIYVISSASTVDAFLSSVIGKSFLYSLYTPEVTDISSLITSDNLLPVQGNGVLIFENANSQAVPSTVEFITAEATA